MDNEETPNNEETSNVDEVEIIEEETAETQNAELTDKLQRTLAEFDNFRKRTAKEKASMFDEGVSDTITKILPVIDNLERAISTLDRETEAYKGVNMIYKQFEQVLADVGVETIDCVNQTFDPNLHFAVAVVEDENFGEQEVIEELQKGYKYKDKILRHSMVRVAN